MKFGQRNKFILVFLIGIVTFLACDNVYADSVACTYELKYGTFYVTKTNSGKYKPGFSSKTIDNYSGYFQSALDETFLGYLNSNWNFDCGNGVTCCPNLYYGYQEQYMEDYKQTYVRYTFSPRSTDSTQSVLSVTKAGVEGNKCIYSGKKNGNSIIITPYSDQWSIVYPDGTTKEIAKTRVNYNTLPSDKCEDIFYSAKDKVIKTVDTESKHYKTIISTWCRQYDDLEQFCNGDCEVTDAICGNNEQFETEDGECPSELRPAIVFIKRAVFNTLQIFVPIILIIMGSIDLVRSVMASDEKDIKSGAMKFMKRALIAVLFFFITTIVSIVIGLFANNDVGSKDGWKACWLEIK